MKRYQLPDVLGGGVIEADEIWGGCAGGQPEYRLVGGFTVLAPKGQPLGEVAPPLPPEPPVWSAVSVDRGETVHKDVRVSVYQHQRRGSSSACSRAGFSDDCSWTEVCATGTPVLLVPAPEPVEPTVLPFEFRSDERGGDPTGPAAAAFVKVDPDCSRRVRFGFYNTISRTATPAQAREIARAFLTAADEAQP